MIKSVLLWHNSPSRYCASSTFSQLLVTLAHVCGWILNRFNWWQEVISNGISDTVSTSIKHFWWAQATTCFLWLIFIKLFIGVFLSSQLYISLPESIVNQVQALIGLQQAEMKCELSCQIKDLWHLSLLWQLRELSLGAMPRTSMNSSLQICW